jgi:hypothetical protein
MRGELPVPVGGRVLHGAWLDVATVLTGAPVPAEYTHGSPEDLSAFLRTLRGNHSARFNDLGIYMLQWPDLDFTVVRPSTVAMQEALLRVRPPLERLDVLPCCTCRSPCR